MSGAERVTRDGGVAMTRVSNAVPATITQPGRGVAWTDTLGSQVDPPLLNWPLRGFLKITDTGRNSYR